MTTIPWTVPIKQSINSSTWHYGNRSVWVCMHQERKLILNHREMDLVHLMKTIAALHELSLQIQIHFRKEKCRSYKMTNTLFVNRWSAKQYINSTSWSHMKDVHIGLCLWLRSCAGTKEFLGGNIFYVPIVTKNTLIPCKLKAKQVLRHSV